MVENHVSPTSVVAGGRKKRLKIMSVQHLDGTRKDHLLKVHKPPPQSPQTTTFSYLIK